MRKLLVIAALAVGTLGLGAVGVRAATLPGGIEGCIVTAPGANVPAPGGTGNVLNNASCTYKATRPGAYMGAADSWRITIKRVVNGKLTTITYSGNRTSGGPHCNTNVIRRNDVVTVTAANGVAAAGAPTPPQTDAYAPAAQTCPKFPV